MSVDIGTMVEFLNEAGVVGIGTTIIVGLMRRWWVPGWMFTECEKEKDEWKNIALSLAGIAEKVTTSHE